MFLKVFQTVKKRKSKYLSVYSHLPLIGYGMKHKANVAIYLDLVGRTEEN